MAEMHPARMTEPEPNSTAQEAVKAAQCRIRRTDKNKTADPRKSNRVMSRIIPPILVMVAVFSTYVWFDMCIQWYLRNGKRATGICLLCFQILLLILLAGSFFRIIFTPAGYLPNRADREQHTMVNTGDSLVPPRTTLESLDSGSGDDNKTYGGRPTKEEIDVFLSSPSVTDAAIYIARTDPSDGARYCSVCDVEKYDRAHHCSEVNRCIMKFDHYCPWVGGPIGFTRYKFFFLFITYVALYCIFITITLGIAVAQRRQAIKDASSEHIPANPGLWYACIALGGLFGALMVPFSIFHGHQIAINKSTLEYLDTRGTPVIVHVASRDDTGMETMVKQRIYMAPDTHPFDLGAWHNWQQVLGIITIDRWMMLRLFNWILPIQGSPGNGLTYPYNEQLIRNLQAEAEKFSYDNPSSV